MEKGKIENSTVNADQKRHQKRRNEGGNDKTKVIKKTVCVVGYLEGKVQGIR